MLTIGLVFGFTYYLSINKDKYLSLLYFSPISIILIIIFTLIGMMLNGLINTILFRDLGVDISHRDGFALGAASTLANLLPISGGLIAKGYYLKQRYYMSYTKFFSVTLALFVYFVSTNGMIGLITLFYWEIIKNITASIILWAGFSAMAASVILFNLPLSRLKIAPKFSDWTSQAIDGWTVLHNAPRTRLTLIGLQTSMMLLIAARFWIAFHMLSQDVSFGETILFASATVLTQLVTVAPGGLGITEILVAGVAALLGFDVGVSMVAVGLDRLISTIVFLLVGGISTVLLSRQISDSKLRNV